MIQNKIELKLLRVLTLLHQEKLNIVEGKDILYSNIQDVHNRVELIYDMVRSNKGRDYSPNGIIIQQNETRTGVEQ